jgi:hypothetical protein
LGANDVMSAAAEPALSSMVRESRAP